MMHWFGELLGIYIVIAVVIFSPMSFFLARKLKYQSMSAKLDYTKTLGWTRACRKLYDANTSVIAEMESGSFMPESIKEEVFAAHAEARKFFN